MSVYATCTHLFIRNRQDYVGSGVIPVGRGVVVIAWCGQLDIVNRTQVAVRVVTSGAR